MVKTGVAAAEPVLSWDRLRPGGVKPWDARAAFAYQVNTLN